MPTHVLYDNLDCKIIATQLYDILFAGAYLEINQPIRTGFSTTFWTVALEYVLHIVI